MPGCMQAEHYTDNGQIHQEGIKLDNGWVRIEKMLTYWLETDFSLFQVTDFVEHTI